MLPLSLPPRRCVYHFFFSRFLFNFFISLSLPRPFHSTSPYVAYSMLLPPYIRSIFRSLLSQTLAHTLFCKLCTYSCACKSQCRMDGNTITIENDFNQAHKLDSQNRYLIDQNNPRDFNKSPCEYINS